MISGNHSHRCRVCEKEWPCPQITHCKRPDVALCADHDNPGTYYNDKAELAHALREAIRAVEEVRKLDGGYSDWHDQILRQLHARLEQAEYVGD